MLTEMVASITVRAPWAFRFGLVLSNKLTSRGWFEMGGEGSGG